MYSSGHITGSFCPKISLLNSSNEKLTMLLDTGASKNIIKKGCLPPESEILEDEILKLSGITEGVTYTLGYVKIPTFGRVTIFHVVNNDFPIQQSGILSSEFFSDNSTKIDYENQVFEVCGKRYSFRTGEVMAFAARERRLFFARVTNNIEEGYTPYMTYGPDGIIIELAFVRNQDGKAYFFLTNVSTMILKIRKILVVLGMVLI